MVQSSDPKDYLHLLRVVEKKTVKPPLVLVPPRRVFAENLIQRYLRLESIKQD